MPQGLTPAEQKSIATVISEMEAAWNAGDGTAFGASMTEDADFVTIRAEHFRGRQAISAGHDAIFHSIYAGSKNRFSLESARLLRPDVALVHVNAVLEVPTGPLAGRHQALFSAVLTQEPTGWRVASFHNTLAPPATH